MNEWKNADEEKPDKEGEYLAICKNGNHFLYYIAWFNLYESNDWSYTGYDKVVAWMPLPPMPEGVKS